MTLADRVQEWFADHGMGQYPIPRDSPHAAHPWPLSVRFAVGGLAIFWMIVLSLILIAMTVVAFYFIRAAI